MVKSEQMPLGRPPKPRDTSHDEIILARLAQGDSLRQICRDLGTPSAPAVRRWIVDDAAFAEQYARARNSGLDAIAEEIQEIADDGRNDYMTRVSESGVNKVLDAEHVNRSRLRIDARKWFLSKMRPDKYGDLERVQVSGAGGGPVLNRIEVVLVPAIEGRRAPELGSAGTDIPPYPPLAAEDL